MTDSTTAPESDDKGAKQRKAYGLAQTRLREAHRDEFNAFMKDEAKKLGIEWSPKPNAAEKAKRTLEALLAEHPELREEMGLPPEAGQTEG